MTDTLPAARSGAGPSAARPLPLRRNLQFQTIWVGSAASTLGVAVADVAYPLAILAVTGSPGRAGCSRRSRRSACCWPACRPGSWPTGWSPRLILIISETCRALVTGVIVVALVMGRLSSRCSITSALLLGIGQPVASTARMLLVRSAVVKEQLTSALTQDEVRINGAALTGRRWPVSLCGRGARARRAVHLHRCVVPLLGPQRRC